MVSLVGGVLLVAGLLVVHRSFENMLIYPTDFTQDYAAAMALRTGQPLYTHFTESELQHLLPGYEQIRSTGQGKMSFHPPSTALFFVPLTLLPYQAAAFGWGILLLLLTFASVWIIVREMRLQLPIPRWAWQTRRWWLLAAIVALTIAAKPQTTLLVAGVLALLALREGAWYPLLVCGLAVALPTFALEPTWISQWFAAVEQYRTAIGMHGIWQWVPVGLLLLFLRQYWSGLAVFQVAFFPTLFGYTLLPLLIGYIDAAVRRFALLAVAGSWVSVLLVGGRPEWLLMGLCYLVPMVIGGIHEKKSQRQTL